MPAASQIQYRQLLTIELRHEYFEDGLAKSLTLKPDPNTLALLSQFGLRLRQQATRTTIYYEASRRTALQELESDFLLNFQLVSDDPYLLNYTDLPLELTLTSNTRLLLQNRYEGTLLHQESRVSAADLAEAPDHEKRNAPTVVGSVQLSLQKVGHQLVTADEMGVSYVIQFGARSVIWKYFIIARQREEGPTYQITDLQIRSGPGQSPVPFGAAVLFSGPPFDSSRETVFLLQSDVPIPLRERYSRYFELDLKQVSAGADPIRIMSKLPTPDPKSVQSIPGKEGEPVDFYSEVFVYL